MPDPSKISLPIPHSYGYQTVTNHEGNEVFGSYRSFLEVMSFVLFISGLVMNSGILLLFTPVLRTLDNLDGFLLNLIFGELVATLGLSFMFFYQFTHSLVPMGSAGCSFVTWLNVTSVSISVTALISITLTLYNRMVYGENYKLERWKFCGSILLTWLAAGMTGLPYLATAKMGNRNYCTITNWSQASEIIFICAMIIFQVVLPLALLIYLIVKIFLALQNAHSDLGDAVMTDENMPGSEASVQRAVARRQVIFVVLLIVSVYILLIITSFISLGIQLNINNIKEDLIKYANLRELVSLFQCLKSVVIPVIFIFWYDKLKKLYSKKCCKRNQEMYKNLQYSVYQDTVHEAPQLDQPNLENRLSREIHDDIYETDRDDVAILHINE